MKKAIIILIPVVFTVVVYLVASFTLWEFNAAKWSGGDRFLVVMFGLGIGSCIAKMYNDN